MDMIKAPIIIVDDHDLIILSSSEEIERQIEAIDVKENMLKAYDAEGHLLKLAVAKKKIPIFFGLIKMTIEYVVISKVEENPAYKNELCNSLINFLIYRKGKSFEETLKNLSINELIELIWKKDCELSDV